MVEILKDVLKISYSEDFSNYWTASLFFKSPENGTYKMVPQKTNFVGIDGGAQPKGGGITIYYMTPFRSRTSKVTPFPKVTASSTS